MLAENIEAVQNRIQRACLRGSRNISEVHLVCVTKEVAPDQIKEALSFGISDIGENRVQEALDKYKILGGSGARWHMVGHLQRNKVKDAVRIFDVIHSVDSLELAKEIDKRADRTIDIFIEVNISGEATKYGIEPEKLPELVQAISLLKRLRLKGLMTVAPLVVEPEQARQYFKALKELNDRINCVDLSMGMSNDFEVAIEEGSTYVRIGTAIFKR